MLHYQKIFGVKEAMCGAPVQIGELTMHVSKVQCPGCLHELNDLYPELVNPVPALSVYPNRRA